jgi:hypothetical protein
MNNINKTNDFREYFNETIKEIGNKFYDGLGDKLTSDVNIKEIGTLALGVGMLGSSLVSTAYAGQVNDSNYKRETFEKSNVANCTYANNQQSCWEQGGVFVSIPEQLNIVADKYLVDSQGRDMFAVAYGIESGDLKVNLDVIDEENKVYSFRVSGVVPPPFKRDSDLEKKLAEKLDVNGDKILPSKCIRDYIDSINKSVIDKYESGKL